MLTYSTQLVPNPTPSSDPAVKITGNPADALVWLGVVFLVIAIALVFRPRGSNAE